MNAWHLLNFISNCYLKSIFFPWMSKKYFYCFLSRNSFGWTVSAGVMSHVLYMVARTCPPFLRTGKPGHTWWLGRSLRTGSRMIAPPPPSLWRMPTRQFHDVSVLSPWVSNTNNASFIHRPAPCICVEISLLQSWGVQNWKFAEYSFGCTNATITHR